MALTTQAASGSATYSYNLSGAQAIGSYSYQLVANSSDVPQKVEVKYQGLKNQTTGKTAYRRYNVDYQFFTDSSASDIVAITVVANPTVYEPTFTNLNTINCRFTNTDSKVSYEWKLNRISGSNTIEVASGTTTNNNITQGNLLVDTQYFFTVRSVLNGTYSGWAMSAAVTTRKLNSATIQGFTKTGANQGTFTWKLTDTRATSKVSYDVFLNGNKLGNTTDSSYTITGMVVGSNALRVEPKFEGDSTYNASGSQMATTLSILSSPTLTRLADTTGTITVYDDDKVPSTKTVITAINFSCSSVNYATSYYLGHTYEGNTTYLLMNNRQATIQVSSLTSGTHEFFAIATIIDRTFDSNPSNKIVNDKVQYKKPRIEWKENSNRSTIYIKPNIDEIEKIDYYFLLPLYVSGNHNFYGEQTWTEDSMSWAASGIAIDAESASKNGLNLYTFANTETPCNYNFVAFAMSFDDFRHTNSAASNVVNYQMIQLAAPKNLQFDGDSKELSWDPVENVSVENRDYYRYSYRRDSLEIEFHTTNETHGIIEKAFPVDSFIQLFCQSIGNPEDSNPKYITSDTVWISTGYVKPVSNLRRDYDSNGDSCLMRWDDDANADGYNIYRNGEYWTSTVTKQYDLSNLGPGTYTIGVAAHRNMRTQEGTTEEVESSIVYLEEFTIRILETPVIEWEGKTSVLKWEPIEYADFYIVNLGTQIYRNNYTDTSVTITTDDVGTHAVSVRAEGNDNFLFRRSAQSNTLQYEVYQLGVPQNIHFENEERRVVWDEVENCSGYNVIYNGAEPYYTTLTYYNTVLIRYRNTIQVQAIDRNRTDSSRPRYLDSAYSAEYQFGKLPTPVVQVEGKSLKFYMHEVPEDEGTPLVQYTGQYNFEVYDTDMDEPVAVIDETTYPLNIQVEKVFNFLVRAKSNNPDLADSDLSNRIVLTVNRVRPVTGEGTFQVQLDAQNILTWEDISTFLGADYFDVYVNGDRYRSGLTLSKIDLSTLLREGRGSGWYHIYVKACSNKEITKMQGTEYTYVTYIDSYPSATVSKYITPYYQYSIKIDEETFAINVPFATKVTASEELDTGNVSFYSNDGEEYKAYTEVELKIYSDPNPESWSNPGNCKIERMLVERDKVSEVQTGETCKYLHEITLVELTKMLQNEFLSDISITQDLLVVQRQYGEAISGYKPNSVHMITDEMENFSDGRLIKAHLLDYRNYENSFDSARKYFSAGAFNVFGAALQITPGTNADENTYVKKEQFQMSSNYLYGSRIPLPRFSGKVAIDETHWKKAESAQRPDSYNSRYQSNIPTNTAKYTFIKHDPNKSHDDIYNATSYSDVVYSVTNPSQNYIMASNETFDIGLYDLIYEIPVWSFGITSKSLFDTSTDFAHDDDSLIATGWMTERHALYDFYYTYWRLKHPGQRFNGYYPMSLMFKTYTPDSSITRPLKPASELEKFPLAPTMEMVPVKLIFRGIQIGSEASGLLDARSVNDEIERILDIYENNPSGVPRKFEYDPGNVPNNIHCPQYTFKNNKSLWEVLLEIGRSFNGIPRLYRDNENKLRIKYDILTEMTSGDIIDETSEKEEVESNMDNYATGFVSNISNMTVDSGYAVYPSRDGWVSPRSNDPLNPTVTKETMAIVLPEKINYIKELRVKVPSGQEYDITSFCFEKTVYNALNNRKEEKGMAVRYTQGDNIIEGFGALTADTETQATLGLSSETYVLTNILESGFQDKSVWENIQDCVFRVTYKPLISTRMFTEQANLADMPNDIYVNFNQDDSTISDTNFGNSAQVQLSRIGNNSLVKGYRATDILGYDQNGKSSYHRLGECRLVRDTLYYADIVITTYYRNYFEQTVSYSKDYNKIDPRIGVSSEYRTYEIPQTDYVNRTLNVNNYCYISRDPYNDDMDQTYMTTQIISDVRSSLATPSTLRLKKQYFYMIPLDEEGQQMPNRKYGIALSTTYSVLKNSISYSAKMQDNISAGTSAGPILAIWESTASAQQKLGMGKYIQRDIMYSNEAGTLPKLRLQLASPTISTLTDSSIKDSDADGNPDKNFKIEKYLPKAKYLTTNLSSTLFNNVYDIDKDRREALQFNYQLHFQTFDKQINLLHSGLTSRIYQSTASEQWKNASKPVWYGFSKIQRTNDIVDTSRGIRIGEISPVTATVSGKKVYGNNTQNENKTVIRIPSVTIPTTGLAINSLVLLWEDNGEVILDVTVNSKDDRTKTPELYLNFSDKKITGKSR